VESQIARNTVKGGGGKPAPARPARKSVVREYAEAFLFAIVLTLFIRSFVIQAFRIPSGSMEDTLLVGDFLFVNNSCTGPNPDQDHPAANQDRAPKRGDTIHLPPPAGHARTPSRCIGVPGTPWSCRTRWCTSTAARSPSRTSPAGRPDPPPAFNDPILFPAPGRATRTTSFHRGLPGEAAMGVSTGAA
jgi:hypothetical protein